MHLADAGAGRNRVASGRSHATQALKMLVGSTGREPIGGTTHFTAEGCADIQTQRAGHWKPLALMVNVRARGERAEIVLQALVRRG